MISVPTDIAEQSKHAADWLDRRKEQGPSPVLARAKRQMEELEVDWADAFAMPETEPVTAPRQKKRWVVNRLPWQEPPRLQLLGSLSPAAPREPTPLLRLLGSHSHTAPEEPTPLGPENFRGGIG